ncbi:MAG: hypothetical protein OXU20_29205 [Myxococcales bacterium]|nr:hypothetical protein [Myxococcales bacterium]
MSFGHSVAFFIFTPNSQGQVTGVLITGPEHDHAVYCFGMGSSIDFGGIDEPDLMHFTSFSKLRACPTGASDDIVHGCFN